MNQGAASRQRDPDLVWERGFPYDLLAAGGVSPASDMAEVQKAKLHFIRAGKIGDVLHAFAAIEKVQARLWIDFFLYGDERPELPSPEGENHD